MFDDWISVVVRTSGLLATSSILLLGLARWRPLTSPRWHRFAWGFVLCQGLMVLPVSLSLPWPADWVPIGSAAPMRRIDAPRYVNRDESRKQVRKVDDGPTWIEVEPFDRIGARAAESNQIVPPPERSGKAADPDWLTEPVSLPVTFGPRDFDGAVDATDSVPESHPAVESSIASSPRASSTEDRNHVVEANALSLLERVWAAGLAMIMSVLAIQYLLLRWTMLRSSPAGPGWQQELQQLAVELAVTQHVRLDVHSSLGPFLYWTPSGYRIVIPSPLWRRLPATQRIAVLHHELCHLRRGDLWTSFAARLVVAAHWFNPLAWFSARKFDESAEWLCDTQIAAEAPSRVTELAKAILAAAELGGTAPRLACAVTGSPVFLRVRRLIDWQSKGDPPMRKFLWTGLMIVVAIAGGIRLQLSRTTIAQEQGAQKPGAQEQGAQEQGAQEQGAQEQGTRDAENATGAPSASARPTTTAEHDAPAMALADRITAGDSDVLKRFVELLKTPSGQIVMADRAALRAQQVPGGEDSASLWESFVERHFEQVANRWQVRADALAKMSDYVKSVSNGLQHQEIIRRVFQETAESLDTQSDLPQVMRRFLLHDSAASIIYHNELRGRLDPGMDELSERFQDHLVRNASGHFVIRPARRSHVQRRLEFLSRLDAPLRRVEKELAAWAEDLAKQDALHRAVAETLAQPEFARFVVFSQLNDESRLRDDQFEGIFAQLEEATNETAVGLTFNLESEAYKQLDESLGRFRTVWEYRQALSSPLHNLADLLENSDDLHARLAQFLKSDLALLYVAQTMNYLPVQAEAAAREWIAQFATRDESGRLVITVESQEDLRNRFEEYFRQVREVRRRGRVIDEFSTSVADEELRSAMTSVSGKLSLARLVEQSAIRPDVDGLELWINDHFQETPDGLTLNEWAEPVIAEIITEAAEITKELANSDF